MKIIVVGSGIAGLTAALELAEVHEVTLVTKGELAESNTRWAQGGIAAVMFDDDKVADHIADTLTAGAGLCNRRAVEILCAEGPARIRDLIALGVAFDQREGELAKGLEAAHSYPRVLHAGGDATGLSIETALVRAVRRARIEILEHTFACDLRLEHGGVAGLNVLNAQDQLETLAADAVILASGGAGQLYLHTTNPSVATGDGVAMALRAGATLADLEFYQFHPTALAAPGATFLISEAVRGDGAVLLNAKGERFMRQIHADAELAPRDVVARGMAREMARQGNAPVLLDATGLGTTGLGATGLGTTGLGATDVGAADVSAAFLRERFPTIDGAVRARGLDWSAVPIPVTPAAHYWMGGIRTDLDGLTDVDGLYAIGECACTGVHGANRLASNSLLESLVFAHRCAVRLAGESGRNVPRGTFDSDPPEVCESALKRMDRLVLQTTMWELAGIERTAEGLDKAQAAMEGFAVSGSTVEERETANLLMLARALVGCALAREESRGAHFRLDFPATEPAMQCQSSYQAAGAARGLLEASAC